MKLFLALQAQKDLFKKSSSIYLNMEYGKRRNVKANCNLQQQQQITLPVLAV